MIPLTVTRKTMSKPDVLLSAFADEAAVRKSAVEQMAVLAALGLRYYSPRFVDVAGSGTVKHVVTLTDDEFAQLRQIHGEYGMKVASIGSRIGKVKLKDGEDGSHNRYIAPQEYIDTEVTSTLNAAVALGAKLVRGFSFYPVQGTDPASCVAEAAQRLIPIVDLCAARGLIYGLEVEANLVGQNGRLLAELARAVNRPNLVCIYDGGNLSSQNMSRMECFDEYVAMRPYMGWMHIKDYRIDPKLSWRGFVDEERLKNFVPADEGDSGHEEILKDLKLHLKEMTARMQALGADGVFLELEPHLKGGGQFGGFSGPDGMGVAVRSLGRLLHYVGIRYSLRTMADIREDRGF